ncbi:MAG TPA: ribbon-helix-helix domain-containing protein, partial [Terriglobia bacterium]|nr:ribbon-helix-helix domain-containing protein [Terriglobia bacterium]
MPQWTVRMPEELAEKIRGATQERGFSSPRAFVREAIRRELQSRTTEAEALEGRIAASLDRLATE